jgi:hypothetical protein
MSARTEVGISHSWSLILRRSLSSTMVGLTLLRALSRHAGCG